MKIRDKLEFLRKRAPNRDATGQLWKERAELSKRFKRISLYCLLVSEENTHQIHEAVIKKDKGKDRAEWAEWLAKHFENIYVLGVLAGIGLRTEKKWSVQKILGWVGHAKHVSRNSKMARKRHKTKRQGSKNGQVHIRRRQRNAGR